MDKYKFNIDELLPMEEDIYTFGGFKKGCYVIIVNDGNLRHIISNCIQSTLKEFISWYYSEYTELENDEFYVAKTRQERDEIIEYVKEL